MIISNPSPSLRMSVCLEYKNSSPIRNKDFTITQEFLRDLGAHCQEPDSARPSIRTKDVPGQDKKDYIHYLFGCHKAIRPPGSQRRKVSHQAKASRIQRGNE